MMKFLFIVSAMLMVSNIAHAEGVNSEAAATEITTIFDGGPNGQHQGPCPDVKATDEQKAMIKETVMNHMKNKVQLEANLKLAMINWHEALTNPNTDGATAVNAADELNHARAKMMQTKTDLQIAILFKILNPEQRPAALMCMHKMKKRHQQHGDHGHNGHGPHPGQHHQGHGGGR